MKNKNVEKIIADIKSGKVYSITELGKLSKEELAQIAFAIQIQKIS